jgi:hypothetical protein
MRFYPGADEPQAAPVAIHDVAHLRYTHGCHETRYEFPVISNRSRFAAKVGSHDGHATGRLHRTSHPRTGAEAGSGGAR